MRRVSADRRGLAEDSKESKSRANTLVRRFSAEKHSARGAIADVKPRALTVARRFSTDRLVSGTRRFSTERLAAFAGRSLSSPDKQHPAREFRVRADGVPFKLPISFDGRPAGVLSGKLRIDIKDDGLEKHKLFQLRPSRSQGMLAMAHKERTSGSLPLGCNPPVKNSQASFCASKTNHRKKALESTRNAAEDLAHRLFRTKRKPSASQEVREVKV